MVALANGGPLENLSWSRVVWRMEDGLEVFSLVPDREERDGDTVLQMRSEGEEARS